MSIAANEIQVSRGIYLELEIKPNQTKRTRVRKLHAKDESYQHRAGHTLPIELILEQSYRRTKKSADTLPQALHVVPVVVSCDIRACPCQLWVLKYSPTQQNSFLTAMNLTLQKSYMFLEIGIRLGKSTRKYFTGVDFFGNPRASVFSE